MFPNLVHERNKLYDGYSIKHVCDIRDYELASAKVIDSGNSVFDTVEVTLSSTPALLRENRAQLKEKEEKRGMFSQAIDNVEGAALTAMESASNEHRRTKKVYLRFNRRLDNVAFSTSGIVIKKRAIDATKPEFAFTFKGTDYFSGNVVAIWRVALWEEEQRFNDSNLEVDDLADAMNESKIG